jgi:hypothetical protein
VTIKSEINPVTYCPVPGSGSQRQEATWPDGGREGRARVGGGHAPEPRVAALETEGPGRGRTRGTPAHRTGPTATRGTQAVRVARSRPRAPLPLTLPTCGPLGPGDDVLPELPHRSVPGHLIVPRQALRELDLRRELHAWNHGDARETAGPPSFRTQRSGGGARVSSHVMYVTRPRRRRPARQRHVMAGPCNCSPQERWAAGKPASGHWSWWGRQECCVFSFPFAEVCRRARSAGTTELEEG